MFSKYLHFRPSLAATVSHLLRLRRAVLTLLCGLLLLPGAATLGTSAAIAATTPWNFVVVVTDDQRFDTLWAMPILQDRLIRRGVNFTNAYVSTPLCCPYRTSFLSGGYYTQNTGVLGNIKPNGGFSVFEDDNALAVLMQGAGYKTAMIGKYMHEYLPGYLPPGWNTFLPKTTLETEGVIAEKALQFITDNADQPFMLYFAPHAPHAPATPAAQDMGLFTDYLYRERGFYETDLSDKPRAVRMNRADHGPDAKTAAEEDELHRNMLRSLQGVDRTLGALLDRLDELNLSQRTIVFFTSDNGYLWGEHGQWGKRLPYEESVRVPMVVVHPGVAAREDNSLVVSNLDIPGTILSLAGLPAAGDGMNLSPPLESADAPWRTGFLIEYFGSNFPAQTMEIWAGLRVSDPDGDWKYVEYATGEKELYDLLNDPFELDSLHAKSSHVGLRNALAAELSGVKGLAITTLQKTHSAKSGTPFRFQFKAWGGDGNYTWTLVFGALPAGLTLSTSGLLSGTPTASGNFVIRVQVEDTRLARYANRPQRFIHETTLSVAAPPPPPPPADTDGDGVADTSDNCTLVANADQTDSDADGYGNACDGDLNNDLKTDRADLDLLKAALGKTTTPAADFNADGKVTSSDVTYFNTRLVAKPPGPSGLTP